MIPKQTSTKIFRLESGIFIDPNIEDKYKFVRSIVISDDGNLNYLDTINEIFYGLKKFDDNTIEYFGYPSTIVVDNASVVIASQIYEPAYSENKDKYKNIKNYSGYYKRRLELKKNKKEQ